MRNICVLSGKRGGFGALKPTMQSIQEHPDLNLQLVVTDQHLYDNFGKTISEVEKSFSIHACIDMNQKDDSSKERAKAIGICLAKAADVLESLKPDILLVIGDRGEVFAGCIAAHNLQIPIAHIQGGDLSGSLDEPVRHAITKLAHIHFASTKRSADRLKSMGEELWRIHLVGDTHIDQLFLNDITPKEELKKIYGLLEDEPFLLVLQHSDSTEPKNSALQMAETIKAVKKSKYKAFFIYPCSDQGYQGIIDEIEKIRNSSNCSIFKNIPAPDFMGLQGMAACLIGNSSAGLIEAPYFGLPSINIGNRQRDRERTENVIDVDYNHQEISSAIEHVTSDQELQKKLKDLRPPFGDGTAYKKITKVLDAIPLGEKILTKRMTY